MNQKNNENNQGKVLLLEAPKPVPTPVQETPPVEANEAISEASLDPSDTRKYGKNTGKDYEVGKGKPPVEHQFQPGNSGKPLGTRHFSTMFREAIREFGGVTKDGQKVTYDKVITKKLITMAADGNLKAAGMVIDRVDGKVPQVFEVNKTQRVGVVVYTQKEIEDYELMFSRNDKRKANSIAQTSDDGGTPSAEGATEGSAYE